jgi:hypothetical protein
VTSYRCAFIVGNKLKVPGRTLIIWLHSRFIKTKSKQTKLKNHVIVKRDGLLPLLVATDSLARDEERGVVRSHWLWSKPQSDGAEGRPQASDICFSK